MQGAGVGELGEIGFPIGSWESGCATCVLLSVLHR